MKRILFLCSGNYYRSRFAEYLFNALAERRGLAWQADSRGLAIGCITNVGPISRHAIDRLHALGVSLNHNPRNPRQLVESDLAESDLVIALKETEHRPQLENLFPAWAGRVRYWHIDDLDCAAAEEALPVLENNVRVLVDQLADNGKFFPAHATHPVAGVPLTQHAAI